MQDGAHQWHFGNMRVLPREIDGVLVIPQEVAEEVIEKSLEKASGEKKVRKAIENGMSATEAFRVFGIL